MNRTAYIVLLAATCLGAAPDSAAARLSDHEIKPARLAAGKAAATAYWGTAAPVECGPKGITFKTMRDTGQLGLATGPCDIFIDLYHLKYDRRKDVCRTIVHEIGHALGRDHTEIGAAGDPLNVMGDNVTVTPGYPPLCKKLKG